MFTEVMKMLGARVLEDNDSDLSLDLTSVEVQLGVNFSDQYRRLLQEYEGSIVFDNGAQYKPAIKSPVDYKDGHQTIEILYGLSGKSNIVNKNKMYGKQLPLNIITIGESSGGNQICLSIKDGKTFFWHHEAITDDSSLYKIADDLDALIANLKPDNSGRSNDREIDESGTFFDF